jgi:ketosteroid isomerase-like protein
MTGIRRGVLAVGLITALSACQPPADRSASAEQAVRAADIAWAQAFSRKDLAGYLAFVDSTASIQQPNAPTVTGTAAIRALIEGFYALPNLSGTWQPTSVEASRSGDLAYSTGTYELSFNDPSGKPVTERGKYVEIWRQQADGSWKMVVESFNSDLPLPGAASN